MSSSKGGNFFGLFGCDLPQDNINSAQVPNKRLKVEELEEGEIAEQPEIFSGQDPNDQFDTLLSKYDQARLQESTFKECKKCFICSANKPNYTCPKCGMKTCSLNCCLLHKKNYDCDGQRDRLSFVPLKSYSDQNFNSDCAFINETCEIIGNSSRFFHNNPTKDVSNWTARFIQETAKRKIQYKKMPIAFKKAKENKSLFIYREKCILWDVEFVLPYCIKIESDDDGAKQENYFFYTYKKSRISENAILNDLVQIILNEESLQESPDEQNMKVSIQTTPYKQSSNGEIVALFKHDSSRFFYKLDLTKSLLENFTFKTIVEYPTIYVILSTFLSEYNIQTPPHQ